MEGIKERFGYINYFPVMFRFAIFKRLVNLFKTPSDCKIIYATKLPKFAFNKNAMTIRRVILEDAETLSQLGADTFYNTFKGTCTDKDMDEFLFDYYDIEQVKKELSDPNDYFYFAEVEGKAVGYLRIKEDYTAFEKMKQWKALELKRLYISADFHGKGIAQALTNFAFDFAKENNYEVIWLGVWEHNERAKKYYQKMGFEDTGHTHDFPIGNTPQTDLWYWKFLNK